MVFTSKMFGKHLRKSDILSKDSGHRLPKQFLLHREFHSISVYSITFTLGCKVTRKKTISSQIMSIFNNFSASCALTKINLFKPVSIWVFDHVKTDVKGWLLGSFASFKKSIILRSYWFHQNDQIFYISTFSMAIFYYELI